MRESMHDINIFRFYVRIYNENVTEYILYILFIQVYLAYT